MAIEQKLTDRIEGVKKRAIDTANKLVNVKKQFNKSMNVCIEAVTGENYSNLEKDPAYIRYKRKNTDKEVKDWLNSLSTAEKVEILVEYSIDDELNGKNVYEKDLKDAQKLKDATKAAIKLEVKTIKEDFNELIEQHKKDIKELEEIIAKKEEDIKKAYADLAEISKITTHKGVQTTVNEKPAEVTKEYVERLKHELDTDPGYKDKLSKLKKDTKEYENQIKTAIAQMEQYFRAEGIEINEEVEAEMENSESSNSSQQSAQDLTNSVSQTQSRNSQDNIDMYSGKPVDVARRMMEDFKNLSPEGQQYVVKYGAYEDLLNMTKNLNLWDQFTFKKRNIRNAMLNRIDDLGASIELDSLINAEGNRVDINGELINSEGQLIDSEGNPIINDDGTIKMGTLKLNKEDLLNLGQKDDKYLDRVVQQISYYTREYDNMNPSERRKANETMQILKMAMVAIESKRGAIRRGFANLSQKGTRITELGKTLTDFANSAGERDIAAYDKSKKLREMLHIKVNPRKSKVKNGMDASTKTIFQRKTNRGQER